MGLRESLVYGSSFSSLCSSFIPELVRVVWSLPVIVSGNTHYRGKGFTMDPASWAQYFEIIEAVLESPDAYQFTEEKLKTAWHYAYCFFFEYPFPSPWHLHGIVETINDQPISRLVSDESLQRYGATIDFLLNQAVADQEKE